MIAGATMRSLVALVGAIGLALAVQVRPSHAADVLYRCEAEDGARSYGARVLPGQRCAVVADASARHDGQRFRTDDSGQRLPAPVAPADAKVSRGAVYKYERDGITHYTNIRPSQASDAKVLFTYIQTCFACGARPGVDFHSVRLNTRAFDGEIAAAAREHGVEEALLRAVIHAESAFDPNARSHKGAQGLMQLMPATAERFGVGDPFQPEQNIRGGSAYLAWLLKRFKGDTTLAAAAYNAGEGAVDRHGGVPPYQETQRYVERVAILAERYRGALAAAGGSP